jgi:outer membrane autotransporter protein
MLALQPAFAEDGTAKLHLIDSESAINTSNAADGWVHTVEDNDSTVVTIRDSEFRNEAEGAGSAVRISGTNAKSSPEHVLNIVADAADVSFGASERTRSGAGFDLTDTTVNVYAAEGRRVVFGGEIMTSLSNGSYEEGGRINVNRSGETYSYYDADGVLQTAEAKTGGEVVFDSYVTEADLHLYGGTVTLSCTADSCSSYMRDKDFYDVVSHLAVDTELTVDGATTLRTREAAALTPDTYEAGQAEEAKADAAALATSVTRLHVLPLGWRVTMNNSLRVQPAVNLGAATSDNGGKGKADLYSTYNSESAVAGSGKIIVTGWIVTADNEELQSITVNLTSFDNLANSFGIEGSGKIAIGPVHIWQVAQKAEGSSEFVFTLPGDENEYFDSFQPATDSVESPVESPVVSQASVPADTPMNYNPDLYGAQVAAMGTAVIQHTISDAVFSEAGGFGAVFASDETKPERREWWGKAVGSSLELKTKNFYDTDYSFGLAMIGRQFAPIKTEAGNIEFGAYAGAATGSAKYADSTNKVRQSGGFTGGSVFLRNGGFFMGANATIGLMQNKLSGVSSNSFSSPWFGVGATAGYTFDIPSAGLGITPSVELSYVSMTTKNYTTSLGTEVKNSGMNSFEASPGLRFDKRFGDGFSAFAKARYAFVTKQPGDTSASYNGVSTALPSIANKNYSEIGVGLQKEAKDFGLSLNVSRSDGGRSGWTGSVRATWRF